MTAARERKSHLLSVLVPVYNERAYLRRCIEKVLAAPLPEGVGLEIVMVNDASTDGTDRLVEELAARHPETIRAFHQEVNQGKGAAIRRAIREMRGDYAIFQDADLEYDPQDYPRILQPLLEGRADVVYGSRFAASQMRRILNYHHTLGNLLLTHVSNMFTGLNLTDMETCYKAFRADVLKTIPLRCNRFGIEPEITAKIAKRGCAVYEVPISYHGRSYAEGKKIGWKDGVSALYRIVKYWLLDDCYDESCGRALLSSLAQTRRFCRWQAEAAVKHSGSRILEVGSGVGSISRFLPKKERLTVTDADPAYLGLLQEAYRDNDLVSVEKLDLNDEADFARLVEKHPEKHDTVLCLNALERVEDDRAALRRLRSLLSPGGKLILLVPQHPWLYGAYDRRLGHYRRYDKESARAALEEAGYRVLSLRGCNALAVPGWFVNSRLLGRETVGKWQLKSFDLLVPLTRLLEVFLPLPGLSLLCVAEAQD